MLKLNSNTFYTRHQNELNRYIFNKADTLHIIADDVEKKNLKNDCDYIFVEKEEKNSEWMLFALCLHFLPEKPNQASVH